MSKPEVVTHEQLTNPAGEQSTGMARGQAFAHDGVWCGYADIPGGASTGWHHHGDYATYSYITNGEMTVEFGPGGQEMVIARAGLGLHPRPPRSPRDGGRLGRRRIPGAHRRHRHDSAQRRRPRPDPRNGATLSGATDDVEPGCRSSFESESTTSSARVSNARHATK